MRRYTTLTIAEELRTLTTAAHQRSSTPNPDLDEGERATR